MGIQKLTFYWLNNYFIFAVCYMMVIVYPHYCLTTRTTLPFFGMEKKILKDGLTNQSLRNSARNRKGCHYFVLLSTGIMGKTKDRETERIKSHHSWLFWEWSASTTDLMRCCQMSNFSAAAVIYLKADKINSMHWFKLLNSVKCEKKMSRVRLLVQNSNFTINQAGERWN